MTYYFSDYFRGCDEMVFIEGEMDFVTDTVYTADRIHTVFHIHAKGKGIGMDSGLKYIFNESAIDVYDGGNTETSTIQDRVKLIGQGKASDFYMIYRYHYTYVNHELKVEFDDFDSYCK